MQIILNQKVPENYVIASGKSSTVRDFVRWSFAAAEIDIIFEGSGTKEEGYDQKSGALLVTVNPDFYRVDEEVPLVGHPGKLANTAGWKSEKTAQQVAQLMVESDLGIEYVP
jgi:GDPmannose 4,6-dehydratase